MDGGQSEDVVIMINDKIRKSKQLSYTERIVADYIMEHKEECIYLTADEIGKRSLTSGSAVTRLSKRLGYKGYRELKIELAQEQGNAPDNMDTDIDVPFFKDDSMKTIVDKICYINKSALVDAKRELNVSKLRLLPKMFRNIRKIDFYGKGTSFYLCCDSAEKFMRLGYQTVCINEDLAMINNLNSMNTDTISIFVSYTGRHEKWANVIRELKSKNCKSITVTGIIGNPLSQEGNLNFLVGESEHSDKVAALYSRTSMMMLLDIIFAIVFQSEYEKNLKFIKDVNARNQRLNLL